VSADRWLSFFPKQKIRNTQWVKACRARVELEFPLPADTVLVVEVAANMADAHRVKNKRSRRFPLATAKTMPSGSISGILVMADSAVTKGVVELYDVPPDTLEYFQQPLLRRATTDASGQYVLDWLPVPGGPWLVRAYADGNNDLRLGDQEAQRVLPDTLRLTEDNPQAVVGATTLYDRSVPGRVETGPFDTAGYSGTLGAWSMLVAEADTGWVPAPRRAGVFSWLSPDTTSFVTGVAAGLNRLFVFVDIDGDSTFSAVPETLWSELPDSLRSTAGDSNFFFVLEPWRLLGEIEVEPGLTTRAVFGSGQYNLTPWSDASEDSR